MRTTIFKTVFLALLPGIFMTVPLMSQTTVVFTVDMSDAVIEADDTVGLRGSLAPLSWTETLPMKGPDKEGKYSLKVKFPPGKAGERVMYKYMIGDLWDNDIYARNGNRVFTLYDGEYYLPLDKWDVLEHFPLEYLLEQCSDQNFSTWVNIIGSGMAQGLRPRDIGREHMKFWSGFHGWIERPEFFILMEKFEQDKYEDGFVEVIENSPDKAVYKFRKTWDAYIDLWGKDGEWMGVTKEDLAEAYIGTMEEIMQELGWRFEYKDEGDFAVVTVERTGGAVEQDQEHYKE